MSMAQLPYGVFAGMPPQAVASIERLKAQRMQQQEQMQRGAKPQAGAYGVFPTAYAGALQKKAEDPLFGGMHLAALGMQSEGTLDAYEEALIRAQAGAEELASGENASKERIANTSGYYGAFKDITDAGMHGSIQGGLAIDPVTAMASNATAFAGRDADIRKVNSDANKANYESGIPVDPVLASNRDVSVRELGAVSPYNVFPNQMSPDDTSGRITADAATVRAQAAMKAAEAATIAASRPRGGGGGGGNDVIETQMIPDSKGGFRVMSITKKQKGAPDGGSGMVDSGWFN
jgi:hypothetical protein